MVYLGIVVVSELNDEKVALMRVPGYTSKGVREEYYGSCQLTVQVKCGTGCDHFSRLQDAVHDTLGIYVSARDQLIHLTHAEGEKNISNYGLYLSIDSIEHVRVSPFYGTLRPIRRADLQAITFLEPKHKQEGILDRTQNVMFPDVKKAIIKAMRKINIPKL